MLKFLRTDQVFFFYFTCLFSVILTTSLSVSAADEKEPIEDRWIEVRWTGAEDKNSDFNHILEVISGKSGVQFLPSQFVLLETTELTGSRFQMYAQVVEKIPVQNRNIRIWSDPQSGELIQLEAFVDTSSQQIRPLLLSLKKQGRTVQQLALQLSSEKTMKTVAYVVSHHPEDRMIRDVNWADSWVDGLLLRTVKVKSRRGNHKIQLLIPSGEIVSKTYSEFPQMDIPALVYPIYEETEDGRRQERVPVLLKNIADSFPYTTRDPFEELKARQYLSNKLNPILAVIPDYWDQGYWSSSVLKLKASQVISKLPAVQNRFSGGAQLVGKYVTTNIHPDAITKFQGINFPLRHSGRFMPKWQETTVGEEKLYEVIPGTAYLGKPLYSYEEAILRKADRIKNHDAVAYLNSGFDEIQVYYAVDTFMTELAAMGFTDPELSERPFHAYLYDPDVSMQDNAYYTDDTINFTTYSAKNQNFARDNSTIWHELGHGIMDRLMGDHLTMADTGGLSEGMADFLAQLIIQRVSGGASFDGSDSFRILNQIGFYLTNEIHDDGEAYGGTMNDLLLKAMQKYGRSGLVKVTDLTLEAMRLSRNHPRLTAQVWFEHMLFADTRMTVVRQAGELREILLSSLAGRNYRFDGGSLAEFSLKRADVELINDAEGTRENPIRLNLKKEEVTSHLLKLKLASSETYQFKYPLTVKVQMEGGPLQGAIDWIGDENKEINYVLASETDTMELNLQARGVCERINRDDGSCVDFAYVQLINHGDKKPVAKKRFYLRIKTLEE